MGYIKRERYIRVIGIFSTLAFILLFIYTFTPIYFRTDSADASYTPAETTLSIIASKDTASVEAVPNSANGTFVISNTLNEAEFTVSTNNLTGYSLNILSTDSSGQLVNTNTGDALSTIASDTTEDDFRNGSASTYVNKWGYRLKINGTTTTNFLAAPTTTNRTIHTTSEPNTPGTSDNFTLGIGARIDYTKPSGTYTNTFVLTAVGNPITYQINYLDNSSGSDVAILPAEGSSNIAASAFTLSTITPTRGNYNFQGWCDGIVSHATDQSTCTGTVYQPGDSFTFTNISPTSTNTANLYAMWEHEVALLYDTIASMSKGTQTIAQLQADITIPTSADRTLDTSNSGVYEYNSSVFGTATDASNDYKIYYYRGVLENTVNTYGSNGSAVTYPNYVKLGDTCWRILRTTGSGGVKMIYNGGWSGYTCAGAQDSVQLSTRIFSVDSNKYYGSAFGYTQNGSYNSSHLSATYGAMFGTNTNFSVNSTDSGIKTYIENWYNTSGIKAAYGTHLEADAGYCGDRTLYKEGSWTAPVADGDTVSSDNYYSGGFTRNMTTKATQNPSLTCPRDNADVYTTSAATTGNKQLSEPIALITADEGSFAGSGRSNASEGSSYHTNSFLHTGSTFWLLSPYYRRSYGYAYGITMYYNGFLDMSNSNQALGVRPAISLSPGAKIASGTGIATDPWEVTW